jgi:hypothetical protein
MRCYLFYNNNGDIISCGDAGYGMEINEEAMKLSNPTSYLMEISPEDYLKLSEATQFYKIVNNKIELKEAQ